MKTNYTYILESVAADSNTGTLCIKYPRGRFSVKLAQFLPCTSKDLDTLCGMIDQADNTRELVEQINTFITSALAIIVKCRDNSHQASEKAEHNAYIKRLAAVNSNLAKRYSFIQEFTDNETVSFKAERNIYYMDWAAGQAAQIKRTSGHTFTKYGRRYYVIAVPRGKKKVYKVLCDISCGLAVVEGNSRGEVAAKVDEKTERMLSTFTEEKTAELRAKYTALMIAAGYMEEPEAVTEEPAAEPETVAPATENAQKATEATEGAQAMQSAPEPKNAENGTTDSENATATAEKEELMNNTITLNQKPRRAAAAAIAAEHTATLTAPAPENLPPYIIKENTEKNGIEVYFSVKPAESIREALKALRFRWHNLKKCWYGRADRAAVVAACGGSPAPVAEIAPSAPSAPIEKYNLDGLEGNTCRGHYGAELNKVIREDLKKRGITGVTVRGSRGGGITFTITMRASDFRSAENCAARDGWHEFFRRQHNWGFDLNGVNYSERNEGREDDTHKYISCGDAWNDNSEGSKAHILRSFWLDRLQNFHIYSGQSSVPVDDVRLTKSGRNRLDAIYKIINSYNYDNSDYMSDYFDRGFYDDYEYKMPADFTPAEFMTSEELEELKADQAAEKAAEAARMAEMERERKEAEKRREEAERKEKADRAKIAENITIIDYDEENAYTITELAHICGKECNLEEVREEVQERGTGRTTDAKITRKVIFTDAAALEAFNNMFLYDFEFLEHKGGTGTDDPRVNGRNLYQLTAEQRESIKWYICNAVAVYYNSELQYVIDPQGYSYARYVHLPTGCTEERQKADIEPEEPKPDFYIPAPVEEQIKAVEVGAEITILKDGGICANMLTEARGTVTGIIGNSIDLRIQQGRKKPRFVNIPIKNKTLVFPGILPPLPDCVVYKSVTKSEFAVCKMGADNAEQLKNALEYFGAQGITPIIDTVAR